MIEFLGVHPGLIGLLFFFVFFCVIIVWVYRPKGKTIYKNHANIPFEEND